LPPFRRGSAADRSAYLPPRRAFGKRGDKFAVSASLKFWPASEISRLENTRRARSRMRVCARVSQADFRFHGAEHPKTFSQIVLLKSLSMALRAEAAICRGILMSH
jgi:hypothetical protein